MLKSHNILCLSSIDWDFIWQGHQEIMSTYAENGNRILFIENTGIRAPTLQDIPRIKKRIVNWSKGVKGIRKERENLYIFSPLVIPFPYSLLARWINRHILMYYLNKWMRVMDFHDLIIWTFLPTGLTLDLISYINNKIVVYYCIDKFAVSSALARKVESSEKKLLKKADLVFVTAKELYDYCSQYSQKVHTFPFGVNIQNFERIRTEDSPAVPEDLKEIKEPIIGYIGGVHRWIDQDLIKNLAQIHSEYSFVFVGPIQTDVSSLSNVDNVHFLGQKSRDQLPFYVNHFSVGIIPYLQTDYTKNVYPTKLNEYFALGKPVVSTDLPEIKNFNKKYGDVVAIGKNTEGFSESLEKAIKEYGKEQIIQKRIRIAQDNTWQKRIAQMNELIEESIERKKHDKDLKWKENLRNFYRATRRKLKTAIVASLLFYIILFHTPFLWFIATPLKIVQAPKRADVIVTFAGGVGESGKAGQGYLERTVHSVDLYKKHFAKKIIFSTGYTYVMQEAEVMKALAVSLGIPAEDIILEKKASSTYENVKFTKEIMKKHHWNSALVVSSPYNMRRVALVYDKIASEFKITLTPVPTSRFYGNEKRVKLKHIKAIVHEYSAIIYYFLKGYV